MQMGTNAPAQSINALSEIVSKLGTNEEGQGQSGMQQAISTMKLKEMMEKEQMERKPIPLNIVQERWGKEHGEEVANLMIKDLDNMGGVANNSGIATTNLKGINRLNEYNKSMPEKISQYLSIQFDKLEEERDRIEKVLSSSNKEDEIANARKMLEINGKKQEDLAVYDQFNQKKIEIKVRANEVKKLAKAMYDDPTFKTIVDDMTEKARSNPKGEAAVTLVTLNQARKAFVSGQNKMSSEEYVKFIEFVLSKYVNSQNKRDTKEGVTSDVISGERGKGTSPENILRKVGELSKTDSTDSFAKDLKIERLREGWNKQIDSLKTKDLLNEEFYESIREKGLDLIDEGKTPQKLLVKPKEEVSDKTKRDWIRRAKSDPRNKKFTDEQLNDWYDKNKR